MKDLKVMALKLKLEKWKSAYYDGSFDPLVSDSEYDRELEKLRNLDPENELFKEVGTEVVTENKVHFSHKMLSLDKVKGDPEIKKWIINHPDANYILSLKLDGCAMQVKYNVGKVDFLALRGDGEVGALITEKVPFIKNLPTEIDHKGVLFVVGEGVISWDSFNRINEESEGKIYVNPRNLANGALSGDSDPLICRQREVQFVAFNCWSPHQEFTTYAEKLRFLENLGFEVASWDLVYNEEMIIDDYNTGTKKRKDFVFSIDGLVLSMNHLRFWEELGESSSAPRYSVALKFPDEELSVKVTGIEWTVSRNGIITPQVMFDSVFLGGANISRASLHNFGRARELNLGVGDVIRICRSNEVIPYVLKKEMNSGEHFSIPISCPCSRRSDVEHDGIRLYCTNKNCPIKLAQTLDHMLKVLDFKGLGEKQLQTLVDSGYIVSVYQFWTINKSDFEIFLGWSFDHARKIHSQLKETMIDVPIEKFIQCLGLKFAGRRLSIKLADCFERLDNMMEAVEEDCYGYAPLGFGPVQWAEFKEDYIQRGKSLIDELLRAGFTVTDKKETSGVIICLTGKLSLPREKFKIMIEQAGHEFTNSITKATTYLIIGEGGGAKRSKAEKLGIEIRNEIWLNNFLLLN